MSARNYATHTAGIRQRKPVKPTDVIDVNEQWVREKISRNPLFNHYLSGFKQHHPNMQMKYNKNLMDVQYLERQIAKKSGPIYGYTTDYDVDGIEGKDVVVYTKKGEIYSINGERPVKSTAPIDFDYFEGLPAEKNAKGRYVRSMPRNEYIRSVNNYNPHYNMQGEMIEADDMDGNYKLMVEKYGDYALPKKATKSIGVRSIILRYISGPMYYTLKLLSPNNTFFNYKFYNALTSDIYYSVILIPFLSQNGYNGIKREQILADKDIQKFIRRKDTQAAIIQYLANNIKLFREAAFRGIVDQNYANIDGQQLYDSYIKMCTVSDELNGDPKLAYKRLLRLEITQELAAE